MVRRMASDNHKIRSEEHVKEEFRVCTADHQHQRMDRNKDAEHFVDILTTFINDVNTSGDILGEQTTERENARREMSESLLNYSFRGTTLSYEELIIAI